MCGTASSKKPGQSVQDLKPVTGKANPVWFSMKGTEFISSFLLKQFLAKELIGKMVVGRSSITLTTKQFLFPFKNEMRKFHSTHL